MNIRVDSNQIHITLEEHTKKEGVFFQFKLLQTRINEQAKLIIGEQVFPVILSHPGYYSIYLEEIPSLNLQLQINVPTDITEIEFIEWDAEFYANVEKWVSLHFSKQELSHYIKIHEAFEVDYDSNERYLYKGLIGMESAQLGEAFRRVEVMAKVAYLEENQMLFSKVKMRLYSLIKTHYQANTSYTHNWWDYEIGIPQAILGVLRLLDYKNESKYIQNCLDIIYAYSPDPSRMWVRRTGYKPIKATGANVIDLLEITIWRLLFTQQKVALLKTQILIKNLLHIVETGDGFYADGSFIQHDEVAYTGSYGEVLLRRLSHLLTIYNSFNIPIIEILDLVYDRIRQSFLPILYKGYALDTVRGRAVAREHITDLYTGIRLYNTILRIAHLAPIAQKRFYQMLLMDNLPQNESDVDVDNRCNGTNVSVSPLKRNYPSFTCFQEMKRYILRRENDLLVVSLASAHITSYEQMNGENLRGWYLGLGAISYYSGGKSPYTHGYYPTINPYYIPGVTNTLKPLDDSFLGSTLQNNISSGLYTEGLILIAFHLKGIYDQIEGYITYLLFEEGLISIASGIKSESNYDCVSTIFNVEVNEEDNYKTDGPFHTIEKNTGNFTYYSPQSLNVEKEQRLGCYRDINPIGSKTLISKTYLKGYINHGLQPVNQNYEYAFLPQYSLEKMKEFISNKPYHIIQNDSTHVIKWGQRLLVNHFVFEPFTIEGITVFEPCQLILTKQQNDLMIQLVVSSSCQKNFTIRSKKQLLIKENYTKTQKDLGYEYTLSVDRERTIEVVVKGENNDENDEMV